MSAPKWQVCEDPNCPQAGGMAHAHPQRCPAGHSPNADGSPCCTTAAAVRASDDRHDPSKPLDEEQYPGPRKLCLWTYDAEKDEWLLWAHGDLADVLEEYFDWRVGHMNWADEIRIGARRDRP